MKDSVYYNNDGILIFEGPVQLQPYKNDDFTSTCIKFWAKLSLCFNLKVKNDETRFVKFELTQITYFICVRRVVLKPT